MEHFILRDTDRKRHLFDMNEKKEARLPTGLKSDDASIIRP